MEVENGVVVVDHVVEAVDEVRQETVILVLAVQGRVGVFEVVLRDDVHKRGRARGVVAARVLHQINEIHRVEVLGRVRVRSGRG